MEHKVNCVLSSERYVKGLPDSLVNAIKRELTLPNPKYKSMLAFSRAPRFVIDKIPKEVSYYHEPAPGVLCVPRGYKLPTNIRVVNTQYNTVKMPIQWPKPKFTPRPWQQVVINLWKGVHAKRENFDSTSVAPPGSGKTVCGLFVAAEMHQRTLVIVHTDGIMRSWKKDSAEMFDGLNVKFWKGKQSCKLDDDTHVVVAMLQTLRNQDVTAWADKFGLVIVDEAHRTPSETVFKVMANSQAAFRCGITATPERTDKLDHVILWACGPIRTVAEKDLKATVPLIACKLRTPFPVLPPGTQTDNFQQNTLWLKQMRRKERAKAVRDIVHWILKHPKLSAPVLIVCARVEYCELLTSLIEGAVHFDVGMKKQERSDFFELACNGGVKVTVATTTMLAEGVNVPPWTHLVITQSFTSSVLTRQVIGRVERAHHGKEKGYIWDLVDECEICRHQFRRRSMVYAEVCEKIRSFALIKKDSTYTIRETVPNAS